MQLVLYGLLIYLLYKIIFDIVIPVRKGVKTVRQNMEQVKRQQTEAFNKAQYNTQTATPPKKEAPIDAEYIDFEEIKKK